MDFLFLSSCSRKKRDKRPRIGRGLSIWAILASISGAGMSAVSIQHKHNQHSSQGATTYPQNGA